MILRKEYYTQKDGTEIIKVFCNNGYFYCDKADEDIIDNHSFEIGKAGSKTNLVVPKTSVRINDRYVTKTFGQMYNKKYYGEYNPDGKVCDHINGVEIDNVSSNLRLASIQQNSYNQFTQGFTVNMRNDKYSQYNTYYSAAVNVAKFPNTKKRTLRPFGCVKDEISACKQQYELENIWLKDYIKDNFVMFDFTTFRRFALDILDLERTGQQSHEEAINTYLMQDHIRTNPWYWFRYSLHKFYDRLGVSEPKLNVDYYINEDNAMAFCGTNQLCRPFKFGNACRVN